MESLVAYKLLLLKNHLPADSRERIDATNHCLTLLRELEKTDPMRLQRYRDIGACKISVVVPDVILVVYRRAIEGMMRIRSVCRACNHTHAKPRHELNKSDPSRATYDYCTQQTPSGG